VGRQKILIIRVDGGSHAQFMMDCLSEAGYETWLADQGEKASDGTEYRTMIRKVIPNLVILDWGLQNHAGLQIIRTIRGNDRKERLPILVIGTEMQEEAVLASLEAGADNCLTESLHPKVLAARVHSLLRRTNPLTP
jgi:two-component system, OmpR family, phosphate regulon response regulator PhoB